MHTVCFNEIGAMTEHLQMGQNEGCQSADFA